MKIIYLVILTGILFTSCQDQNSCDNPTPAKTVQPVPELNQFSFNNGTYWVYQNPQSSQLDSQVVVQNASASYQSTYPSDCDGGTTLATRQISVLSYMDYSQFDYLLIGGGLYRSNCSGCGYQASRLIYSTNQIYGNNETQLIEVIPTLTLNGNVFNNVTKVLVHPTTYPSNTPNISSYDLFLYFADSVGVIKKVEDYGNGYTQTWELKSWEIHL